ncbi:folate-binding protein YgfZ [Nostocoides sp. F2B08]|uniref:CAF17-like 4Fe-4S cluster assembly/insertion protein YgfZ n=1 Tax=Nostocoides sp. F2B08 TaxID=2653936 RepID=UPI00351A2EEC
MLTSPLLDLPGAVDVSVAAALASADESGPGPGGVAAHYGDPMAEQRLLREGRAIVDLSDRGVLTVTGPDRLSWLHSLTSQHLTGLAPGASAETLVLSPKGHIEHALHLVDDGERVWITVEPGTAPTLAAWLDSMRFMLRVEVADVTDEYAVLATMGDLPDVPDLPDLGVEPVARWRDPWPGTEAGELVGDTAAYGPVADHPGADWSLVENVVPRALLAELAGRDDLRWAGTWALEALRIAAWRPRLGAETDHRTIAHEVDWLRTGVHLHKGCYRGQETIARVHNLGRPPRRLVFLHLDGSGHTLPAPGDPVRLGERAVGHVTSVARHYEDGPIALAVIKRNTDPDAVLLVGEGDSLVSAAQTVVVTP